MPVSMAYMENLAEKFAYNVQCWDCHVRMPAGRPARQTRLITQIHMIHGSKTPTTTKTQEEQMLKPPIFITSHDFLLAISLP